MLLAQVFNSLSHHRRENILSALMDSETRVKEILKTQSKSLDVASNEVLFGEEFESQLTQQRSQGYKTNLKVCLMA